MAKSSARVFLFHGGDSLASSRAVQRWEKVFREKYGETTRYILDVDETTPEQYQRQLSELLTSTALFAEPKLIILKRVTGQEKGNAHPYSKMLVQLLEESVAHFAEETTIVVWEEKQLSETQQLYKWFKENVEKKRAVINVFAVPAAHEVGQTARAYLEGFGFNLDQTAERWLIQEYRDKEKAARVLKRLRSSEFLLEDDRTWWLYQLLDTAMLRADGSRITTVTLQQGNDQNGGQPVSLFEITNALTAGQWEVARNYLQEWEKGKVPEGDYFGLYAFLRTQFRKQNNLYALQLLAEIEIISKNFRLEHSWLAELLILRLREVARGGEKRDLLPARTLWLATLPRS